MATPRLSLSLRVEDPFPSHDWYTRATSSSSSDGSMDSSSYKPRSMIAEGSQNAISILLQPPILRTKLLHHTAIHSTSQKPPTSRDIPPVALTNIPHIESSTFKEYLSKAGSLVDAFQSAELEFEDGGVQDYQQDKDDELIQYEMRKTSVSKRGQPAPTPLSTIPSVYFNEYFRLENPRIFDVVSEHAEVVRQPLSIMEDSSKDANSPAVNGIPQLTRKALTTNAILQEKLSWYIDTVEIHMLSSISQASASFSAALGSLRELQEEATNSVAKIRKLSEDLANLDKEMARSYEIINMKRKQDILKELGDATKQLQYVLGGLSYTKELVDSGQLETATHHILYVEQLANGTLDPETCGELHWPPLNPSIRLTDLRQLAALEGPLQDINQLWMRIGKGYEARLLDVLLCDLRRHVSIILPKDTQARWTDTIKRARGVTDASSSTAMDIMTVEKLREELIPVLRGLGQSRYLSTASITFCKAVIQEMKSLIRQHLPSSTDDDESVNSVSSQANGQRLTKQERSSILSRNLRTLSPEDSKALLAKVYCGIGEALRRLGVQVKVLLDITSGIKKAPSNVPTPVQSLRSIGNPPVRSPSLSTEYNWQEEMTEALDMSSLLEQAADKAQSEMIKVLRVRTEQTVRLGLADFLSYFTLNRLFVNECEAVSGHSGAALKGIVNNQIDDFVLLLHEKGKQKLAQEMESEKWEHIYLKPEDAMILTHMIQSRTKDPPAWLYYTDANTVELEAGEWDSQTGGTPAELTCIAEQDKKGLALAIIEGEEFMLVDSVTFALRGIEQYTILLASVPSKANDISTALLDYLKLYNSRTQQLILGTGARVTAGLANINAKHLALASQSLSFFIALIPYLLECVRRRPSIAGSSLAGYDQLKRLFQEHQSSIHEKLIGMMKYRTTNCIKAMEMIKWDDEDEVWNIIVPQMEMLTRDSLILQRVLKKYLPAFSVIILGKVFMNYKEQWSKAFEGAAIRTEAGKSRLLGTAELFGAKLSKIDGIEELSAHLINIVKARQVES